MALNDTPLFTIITVTHSRFDFLRQALKEIMGQTYKNLEIIVVNSGATQEIIDYLIDTKVSDDRIKIVHFKENQYSDDDPLAVARVCFNAALEIATGNYVFYQSDDDLIANDYVEKMVKLFKDDPDCTSAAGFVKCMDGTGRLLDEGPRATDYRPRYMPGHLLALNKLCEGEYGNDVLFNAPGTIFTFKREDLVKAGGYHMAVELSHLYGIVPFGITGFDETAFLYWRRHKDQANLKILAVGHVGTVESVSLIKDWQIEGRWQVFGKDIARYVVRRMLENAYAWAGYWFVVSVYHFRFKAALRMLKDAGRSFYFWRKLPALLWIEKKQFWWYLRPKLQGIRGSL